MSLKKRIIRAMTVDEVSSVDRPAQRGAVAVIIKRDGGITMDIRKNAAAVAVGDEEPGFTAAEFGDEIMKRAEELGKERGVSAGQALLKFASTDPVLCELACAERTAENARLAKRSRRYDEHMGSGR